ncbi:MAG: aminopeptidase, partial [Nanoarchaeota archaeon]
TLQKAGFKDISNVKNLKTGDKAYKTFKNKSVMAFIVGKDKERFRIIGSHMDSPRIDLKPWPLTEDSGLAMLKSHYYGGIKKYQWVNTPLAMHGLVTTKDGKEIHLDIGENENDPKFIIADLLPHLARQQMEKTGSKVIEGEEMAITSGSIPVNDDDIKEQVKFTILKELNDRYGIIEEDFGFAEIQFVPSGKAMDVGLDRGLVGAYGQDDKVCVYSSLQALLDITSPHHTAVGMFVDKEEIGSMGNTGAASMILHNFAYDYKRLTGIPIDVSTLLEMSESISADVTAAVNPNHKGVQDDSNASLLGYGVSVEKYGGGGGKYSTHDAHGEYMAKLRRLLDKNNIAWQTGELGKIDVGGGGTIGMFMSRYGMDCVDAGPSVLSMHSPLELVSKADVYSAYEFYKAFFTSS